MEELTDPRYATVFARYRDLAISGWMSDEEQSRSLFSFVKYSDEIYQAYVATVLAAALDCELVVNELRPRLLCPAFSNQRYDIYYDTVPPDSVARTWRQMTDRPDGPRPDVFLHDKEEGKFMILDAKYRRDGNRASSDSLAEMQYYLNTFQMQTSVICYPPTDSSYQTINSVTGGPFSLWELPVSPNKDIVDYLRKDFVPRLPQLLQS
ncbi:MAG: hypothetical protein ACYDG3_14465 [Bacillati bacterium]